MKVPLVGWVLGLSAAVVMVSICALLLSCHLVASSVHGLKTLSRSLLGSVAA